MFSERVKKPFKAFYESAVAEAAKENKSDKDDEPNIVVAKSIGKAVTHSSSSDIY